MSTGHPDPSASPNPALTRAGFAARLLALVDGETQLEAFRHGLTPILASEPGAVAPGDAGLVCGLALLFDDESLSAAELVTFARRVLPYLRGPVDSGALLEIVPILLGQDRLCSVVRKHGARIIDRAAFLAFLGKARYSASLRHWLSDASQQTLDAFCAALRAEDHAHVARVMDITQNQGGDGITPNPVSRSTREQAMTIAGWAGLGLHDATLLNVTLDWDSGSVAMHVRSSGQGEVVLWGEGITYVELPRRAPWGPSVSIAEIRGPTPAGLEGQRVEIQMQSGDMLVVEGSGFGLRAGQGGASS